MHERIVPCSYDRSIGSEMRQSPRCPCSRRKRYASAKASPGESMGGIGKQRMLPAEQVRDPGGIDQQAIGRIERAPRPPALCPQRQAFKEGKVARGIG